MDRILVTGGAGFIGSNFVHHLVGQHRRPRDRAGQADLRRDPGVPRRAARGPGRAGRRRHRRRPTWSSRWSPAHDAVVHYAAESHNDNSSTTPARSSAPTSSARSRCSRRPASTTPASTTSRPTRCTATSSSTTPSGSPRTRRTTRRQPVLRLEGRLRPPGPRLGALASASGRRSPTAPTTTGPWQHIEKFIPRQITEVIDGRRPQRLRRRAQRPRLDPRRGPLLGRAGRSSSAARSARPT